MEYSDILELVRLYSESDAVSSRFLHQVITHYMQDYLPCNVKFERYRIPKYLNRSKVYVYLYCLKGDQCTVQKISNDLEMYYRKVYTILEYLIRYYRVVKSRSKGKCYYSLEASLRV